MALELPVNNKNKFVKIKVGVNIDILTFLIYNKIMEKNEQIKVAERNNIVDNTQTETIMDSERLENGVKNNQQSTNSNKNPLTPYQKYKNSRNQNGKKYFDFYDDIKVYTHNIYDW